MRRKHKLSQREFEFIILISSFICMIAVVAITAGTKNTNAARAFAAPATVSSDPDINEREKVTVILSPLEEDATDEQSNDDDTDGSILLSAQSKDAPLIFIYHTHTLEAYTPTAENPYREYSGRWRTNDEKHSVVAVGEKLADELKRLGFNVLHDTTDHEPPKLSTAYERSLITMLSYKKKYPEISLYIDLHRDATDEDNTHDYCTINGKQTAKVMFVVGHGTKYDDKPDFDTNFAAAKSVTEYLRSIDPSLARDIREKPGRYNQHVGKCCMLIEIGHNMNTLEQAMSAVPYVAEGIARLYR